ncbi:hypothetical protein NDU88_007573 [Pleurodeles waltl]|uniref:Uncharacterized protein n=1 Tax=Pleurodeles waltl TaxID=8319 RepID=A0AAV7VU79_PLEWA|nr:hypothetical protein NDU88_007573 [Pleurodeles waltl]
MGTLTTHAKRRLEQQTIIIDGLMKELKMVSAQEEVRIMLTKVEERISKQEEKTGARKSFKFNHDRLGYEYGRVYTFAHKYGTLRAKEKLDIAGNSDATLSNTDISSDPGSSADEAPQQKLDFHGEMRLIQPAMPQSTRGRGRGRGGTKRGGKRGKGKGFKE